MRRSVLISGYFTDEEWAELAQILRKIERHHPEELYQMFTVDPNDTRTVEETVKFLQKNFPQVPQEPFDTWVFKKPDTK